MDVLTNYIYLYHLDKFCILPTYPDSITDSMASNFRQTDALARSAPVQAYLNSGPRTVNFTLELHRDLMEDLNTGVSNLKDNVVDIGDRDYIDLLLNYLQACALPKYNVYRTGSKVVDPPQVAVKMGKDIFVRGVISGNISVTYQKPVLDNGKYAKATIGLTITEVDPYDAPTVAMVGGFRGITATFKDGIFKGEYDTMSYSGQEYVTANVNSNTTTISNTTNRFLSAIAENKTTANHTVGTSIPQKKVAGLNEMTIVDTSKLPKSAWVTNNKDTVINVANLPTSTWGMRPTRLDTFGTDTSKLKKEGKNAKQWGN